MISCYPEMSNLPVNNHNSRKHICSQLQTNEENKRDLHASLVPSNTPSNDVSTECDVIHDLDTSTSNNITTVVNMERSDIEAIYENRKDYFIFSSLIPEDDKHVWYYLDTRKNKYSGPYSSSQMQLLFIENVIGKETLIKRTSNSKIVTMKSLVISYYKKTQIEKRRTVKHYGNLWVQCYLNSDFDMMDQKEEEFFFSNVRARDWNECYTRPDLTFLDSLHNENSDSDEDDIFHNTRLRSLTLLKR